MASPVHELCKETAGHTEFIRSPNTTSGLRLAIFIFFEQFILSSVQKRTKKESLTKMYIGLTA